SESRGQEQVFRQRVWLVPELRLGVIRPRASLVSGLRLLWKIGQRRVREPRESVARLGDVRELEGVDQPDHRLVEGVRRQRVVVEKFWRDRRGELRYQRTHLAPRGRVAR